MRVKLKKLLPLYRSTNQDYAIFKEKFADTDLIQGIDNMTSINDDEAYEIAKEVWLDLVDANIDEEQSFFSFVEYLDLLSERAKGFSYELYEINDEDCQGKRKLLSLLWMTATMRRNLELYDTMLFLDMMKRGINKLLWPYVAVSMLDEFMKVCISCEGIVCGERFDTYKFVVSFIVRHCPGLVLSDVKMVSGDRFFNQQMIHDFGFTSAIFIIDHFHLIDSGLDDMFGVHGAKVMKDHLMSMIRVEPKSNFDEIANAGRELKTSYSERDTVLEAQLEKFYDLHVNYATFIIMNIPGNRGRHGSSTTEANHSSVLVFLNCGNNLENYIVIIHVFLSGASLGTSRNQLTRRILILKDGTTL